MNFLRQSALLVCKDVQGETRRGTGFPVRLTDGSIVVITAYHVIVENPRETDESVRPEKQLLERVWLRALVADVAEISYRWIPAHPHLAWCDRRYDIAVLRCEHEADLPPPLPVAATVLTPNAKFAAFGYGGSDVLEGQFASGEINGLVVHKKRALSVLQLSSKSIFPGMSGAAVWDMSLERVVAITSSILFVPDWQERFAAAIPINSLRDLGCPLLLTATQERLPLLVSERRFDFAGARESACKLLLEMASMVEFGMPLLSLLDSYQNKYREGTIHACEIAAIETIYGSLDQNLLMRNMSCTQPVERSILRILDDYSHSDILRTNWEVRCVVGNLATVMLAAPTSSSRHLLSRLMEQSFDIANWDYAQVLFDALHHAPELSSQEERFILGIASEHSHEQARWNVGAALKSIRLERQRVRELLTVLLNDDSEWVRKGVVEQVCKSSKLRGQAVEFGLLGAFQESFGTFPRLAEYALLAEYGTRTRLFEPLIRRMASELIGKNNNVEFLLMHDRDLRESMPLLYTLREDLHRAYLLKSRFKARHGSLYAATEFVILERLRRVDVSARKSLYDLYFHSPDETFAWVCSRLVFHPVVLECGLDFIGVSLEHLLDHRLEWVVRECVQGVFRLPEGPLKRLAFKAMGQRRERLASFREIRPYMDGIREIQ